MAFLSSNATEQTGESLVQEYNSFIGEFSDRVEGRHQVVHARLAELEAESNVLHGLLNQLPNQA